MRFFPAAMTPAELLALLGRAWLPLLIYPGGLVYLAIWWWIRACRRAALPARLRVPQGFALACGWLALALLPLPGARELARPADAILLLALLDLPLWLLVADARTGNTSPRQAALWLAGALNGWPLAWSGLLLLVLSGGGLPLNRLDDGARGPWYWAGAALLVLALVPLLGPGRSGRWPVDGWLLPLLVRAAGWVGFALLPLV